MFEFEKLDKNPILWTDGYKVCHKDQYPAGLSWVYQTWTPRKSRVPGVNHVCFFGLQGALGEMTQSFKENFFERDVEFVVKSYEEEIKNIFWETNRHFVDNHKSTHIRELHKLGYLPIRVKALPEGAFVPIGCPMFTIENTLPNFYWLPGYLETQLSAYIWQPMTAATTADFYRRILSHYAALTTDDISRVFFQAGDFSMRGMPSPEVGYRTGAGHLTSFGVSATISARKYLRTFYDADYDVMRYTPSTEHSVMCSYGEKEIEAFRHLITVVHPSGNLSIVSDTYDFWNIVDVVLPALKKEIMNRHGKILIRPDSGEPVDIICGKVVYMVDDKGNKCKAQPESESIEKGLVERLWEIFGGIVNHKGFRELDPHIGVVYGDSITPDRAIRICKGLMSKGFATINAILGIGSFTYQYNTRDTFGFALKGTAEIEYETFKMIFKNPKTDNDNFKKSQKGMVAVIWNNIKEDWEMKDCLTPEDVEVMGETNCLRDFYIDGKFVYINKFDAIRDRIKYESNRIYKSKPELYQ